MLHPAAHDVLFVAAALIGCRACRARAPLELRSVHRAQTYMSISQIWYTTICNLYLICNVQRSFNNLNNKYCIFMNNMQYISVQV